MSRRRKKAKANGRGAAAEPEESTRPSQPDSCDPVDRPAAIRGNSPKEEEASPTVQPAEPKSLVEPAAAAESLDSSMQGRFQGEWQVRRRRIWFDFRNGMLVATALVLLKLAFAEGMIVKVFRSTTYGLMQASLASVSYERNLPIVVVDISDIKLVDTDLPRRATPRVPLQHLLLTIAKQNPAAIGIDIDFSPDDDGLMFRNDPEFFRFCLGLRGSRGHRIPVLLGVHRTDTQPPELWLDSQEFEDLAASITVPPDNRRMPESIWMTGSVRQLPTMSAALADAYRGNRSLLERSPKWMFRRIVEGSPNPAKLQAGEFFLDFSPLDQLEDHSVLLTGTDTPNPVIMTRIKRPFSGKIVLLGNASRNALDQFSVPNRSELKPGVYLHACATYTLIAKPLFELTETGGLVWDFVLAALAFGTVAVIRLNYYRKTPREVAVHELEVILLMILAAISLLVGTWFVSSTRVMWEDSVLVAFALIAHLPVAIALGWVVRILPRLWRATIFEEADKKEP